MEEEKECRVWDLFCKAKEGVKDTVADAVVDAIDDLAQSIAEALSQIVTTLSTFWVDMPTSNLTTEDGVTGSPTVVFLQDGLWEWTAALAVLAVIIGGTRMVWEQRGAPIRELLRSLLTLTLVSGMGLAAITFLILAADEFSTWIIDQSTDGNGFAPAIKDMLLTLNGEVAVFMVIILGLIGIITSVIQIVLMVVRSGMLVILAGILPTTAAFTNTEMGKQWFQKTIGWTLAFILYKPAASIVYAVAFRLMDNDESGDKALVQTITGISLMVVALVALPALLRFVTPMVGAVAGGSGGGMAAGALGAAASAIPSGAKSMGSAGRGGGKATPTPASNSSSGTSGPGGGGGNKSSGSPSGSSATGSGSGGAKPTPGSSGGGKKASPSSAPSGASPAMAGAGGGAGAGAAAGGGAAAGAAAGPVGAVAGAAVSTAAKGTKAVKQASDDAVGEGPSGSNN